jgi:hypothetical protein
MYFFSGLYTDGDVVSTPTPTPYPAVIFHEPMDSITCCFVSRAENEN